MIVHGRELSVPAWWTLAVSVALLIVLGVGGVLYTNRTVSQQDKLERANDQRWCKLLTTLDDAYQSTPPQSETGRRLAADIHALRAELGCG